MVYYISEGDIFKIQQIKNYAHGCNCAGAMGKGIALQFKNRFPGMYEQYRNLCKKNEFVVGDVFKYTYEEGIIYNLGTQRTWKEKAEMEYIGKSFHKMMEMAMNDGITDIAMPAIGAGLGGGNWIDIKKQINLIASNYPSVDLYVVEQYNDIETNQCYIKGDWREDNITYYIHFIGDKAVRQVEIQAAQTIFLSLEHPVCGDYILYDQSLKTLDLSSTVYITKNEFEKIWQSE